MIDTKQITCEPCGGAGRLGPLLGEHVTCGKCAGTGRVDAPEQDDYSDPLIVPDYAALNADTLGKLAEDVRKLRIVILCAGGDSTPMAEQHVCMALDQ